MALVDFK